MAEPVYPRGERVFTGYYNAAGELLFILTAKETRDYYYLYEFVDRSFRKLGRSRNPKELEEKFNVMRRMRE